MKKISPLLQVLGLSTKLAEVKRSVGYRVRHAENDAEHSFQVALASWDANHQYKLGYDDEKIIKFALVHDLVEAYAGDVDSHSTGKAQKLKKENEKKALEKIRREFPDLKEIIEIIEEYETKKTNESKLVNIVDKIIPIRHVYKVTGNYYKKRKVTQEKWISWLVRKSDYGNLPKELKRIVDETIKEAKTTFAELFYQNKLS